MCTCIHVYVYIYVCIYTYTYTYIYTYTWHVNMWHVSRDLVFGDTYTHIYVHIYTTCQHMTRLTWFRVLSVCVYQTPYHWTDSTKNLKAYKTNTARVFWKKLYGTPTTCSLAIVYCISLWNVWASVWKYWRHPQRIWYRVAKMRRMPYL